MLNQVTLPNGQNVVLVHRDVLRRAKPWRSQYSLPANLPQIELPIDWSKNGSVLYNMYDNDRLGNCMYVAGLHLDNTFTANATGVESTFDQATIDKDYENLSGGDNGLDEQQITSEWLKGLASNPSATILDSLDIDVTNAALVHSAMYLFGGIFFMLSVPDKWINNFSNGCTWDAPASPNPANGHGTCWVSADSNGNYRDITWGAYAWLTPAGVLDCDPSGFVVFSLRWFDSTTGLAPNGLTYDQLAELWVQAGGKALPANPFNVNPLPPSN